MRDFDTQLDLLDMTIYSDELPAILVRHRCYETEKDALRAISAIVCGYPCDGLEYIAGFIAEESLFARNEYLRICDNHKDSPTKRTNIVQYDVPPALISGENDNPFISALRTEMKKRGLEIVFADNVN